MGFPVISMDWEKAMGGGWELQPGSPERMGNLGFVEKKAVAQQAFERSKAFCVVLFMHFLDFTLGLGH